MSKKVLGIVGSYRKGLTVDSLVTETLSAAEEFGATTSKIYLTDKHIEFCTNCRTCAQEPGPERGKCVHNDEMESILSEYDACDALVLGAPVNCLNVTAVSRRFMERLVCYAYWPWGMLGGPQMRTRAKTKKAVLITSSAMPAFMGRIFTGAPQALRVMADTMGARPVAFIFAGLSARERHGSPRSRVLRKARSAGRRLAR